MTQEDIDYLVNYKPNALYTQPGSNVKGAFATMVGDSDQLIGEIDVTTRCKLAVSAFYVDKSEDFGTIKITKMQYHKTYGWRPDGFVQVNKFQLAQMKEFLAIISSLDLRDAKKTRISLDNLDVGALGTLLTSEQGPALIRELAKSPDLHHDIYAVAAKRAALAEFEELLNGRTNERLWQAFFERNKWIFGHGLQYVFLQKVHDKLETVTTGHTFDRAGKRADGLLLSKAAVSQYVLVEIKTSETDLLQRDPYRAGCFAVSHELSQAVSQTQKTVWEFSRNRFRDPLKDKLGNDTGSTVYSVEPRSYLVIGNLEQVNGHDDKIASFELYRRNIRAPEILTFDELYQRASCIVENISREAEEPETVASDDIDDEIPF